MEFTRQELDLLFDAVDIWENQIAEQDEEPNFDNHPMIAAGMLNEDHISSIKEMWKIKARQLNNQRRMRKERGTLLRAKLIQLRDRIDVDEFMNGDNHAEEKGCK